MSEAVTIILRNCLRHPFRTILTSFGLAVALFAFCMIRTMIGAWYAGVEASAKDRLIVRNSVSLTFYLPLAYSAVISRVPGVTQTAYGNWFGGVYKDESFRFVQFAVSDNYLSLYPEFVLTPEENDAYLHDRKGALVGADIAEDFGFKVGDVIQLKGTIFPGTWEFTIRGIFHGRDTTKISRQMFFHWDYLNERNKAEIQRQPDHVGFYVVQVASGENGAAVAQTIDHRFANSYAETLSESETAFQQSFISMSSTIILALDAIAAIVLLIMLLVLSNTMLMGLRERVREFAILKSLGFTPLRLTFIVLGEALVISSLGLLFLSIALVGIFSVPPKKILGDLMNFFPIFRLKPETVALSTLSALLIAILAGCAPLITVLRLRVSEALRKLG